MVRIEDMQYRKVHSAPKRMMSARDPRLQKLILQTMREIADIVGATLGPGGRPVLIERYETDMPPTVTKDGVTVFQALGYPDAMKHTLMESTRDAATRTAREAGDGTTTATILSEAVVRRMFEYCTANPTVSPQRIIARIERAFATVIEPLIVDAAIGTRPKGKKAGAKVELDKKAGRRLLHDVARISANGDSPLADAVLEAFEVCGDAGNVTLAEEGGPSGYAVEEIRGYPIFSGYEDSCRSFAPQFLNERAMSRCVLKNPVFVLYHGEVNDISTISHVLALVGEGFEAKKNDGTIVIVATGFSDLVLGTLGLNFETEGTQRVLPLLAPRGFVQNAQLNLLEDLAAVVGGEVYDPISRPLRTATIEGIGADVAEDGQWVTRLTGVEMQRGRTFVYGDGDEEARAFRVGMLEHALPGALSTLDGILLRERIAALSGGIARIRVIGPSNGETKERRDRAEDAVCAVRGAIKHGALPGGGWTLLRAAAAMSLENDPIITNVLFPALLEPVYRLLENSGVPEDERKPIFDRLFQQPGEVYDVLNARFAPIEEAGIYDAVPAVLEALRSSLSIALRNGTLGGIVVFARDEALERTEAAEAAEINAVTEGRREPVNEANERP